MQALSHSNLGSPFLHNRLLGSTNEKLNCVTFQYSDSLPTDKTQMSLLQRPTSTDCRDSQLLFKPRQEFDAHQNMPYAGQSSEAVNPHHPVFDPFRNNLGSSNSSVLSNVTYTPPLSRPPSRLATGYMMRPNTSCSSNQSQTSNISLNLGLDDEILGRPMHSTPTPHS